MFKGLSQDLLWSASLNRENLRDADSFDCSDVPEVEEYLKIHAITYEECNACRTHLIYYGEKLVGYFTLFTDYVELVKSKRDSEDGWDKLKTLLPSQHYPAIRLHFLGIDRKYREKGLGKFLLMLALGTCADISENVGFNFIVLEAVQPSWKFFSHEGFSVVRRKDDLRIMALKIDDII